MFNYIDETQEDFDQDAIMEALGIRGKPETKLVPCKRVEIGGDWVEMPFYRWMKEIVQENKEPLFTIVPMEG